jgi:hypothetical protein
MLKSIVSLMSSPLMSRTTNTSIAPILQQQQVRFMSKYLSKAATKRKPLTTKRAGKGYYKGNRCTKEGTFSGRAGKFVADKSRMLELVIPDLTGFKVRAACKTFVNEIDIFLIS